MKRLVSLSALLALVLMLAGCSAAASQPTEEPVGESTTLEELCGAADILDGFGIGTAFYNIPLCLIPENYRRFASKSISDWKTRFTDACSGCSMKDGCCGLFATSKAEFRGIRAL